MKINYIIIPLITVLVAVTGSRLTALGMDWYRTISLPSWTPPGSAIGAVWTVIFILTTISVLMLWNTVERSQTFDRIMMLFLLNAILNVGWSYLFFYNNSIGAALVEMLFLFASVAILIKMIYPLSTVAAFLLVPYAVWVLFATYLTVTIWNLNR